MSTLILPLNGPLIVLSLEIRHDIRGATTPLASLRTFPGRRGPRITTTRPG